MRWMGFGRLVLLMLVAHLGLAFPRAALAATRDDQWKKVEDAIKKGLPKTALETLEPIIRDSLRDKAFGEATKAMARKIVLESRIQGNKPEEKIVRLQAALAKAPRPLVLAIFPTQPLAFHAADAHRASAWQ